MIKSIFFISIFLFFGGCEQKHFSRVFDKKSIGSKISSLNLIHENDKIKSLSVKVLKNYGFKIDSNSSYTLKTDYSIYPKTCNNPLATAEQKSYIGFVKFTLFKGKNRLYLCQSDFRKTSQIQEKLEGLVKIMVDEMNLDI
jgi:hypothetical protein